MPSRKKQIKQNSKATPSNPPRKQKRVSRSSAVEEQLKIALEAANMGIWEWDIKKNTVIWSPDAYQIFKIRKSKPLDFDSYQKLIHPDDLDYVLKTINDTITKGVKYFVQHRILRKDGAVRWIEALGKVFRDSKRQPVKMIGTVSDT